MKSELRIHVSSSGSVEDEEWSPKTPSTPAEKVRFLLSRDEDDEVSDHFILC